MKQNDLSQRLKTIFLIVLFWGIPFSFSAEKGELLNSSSLELSETNELHNGLYLNQLLVENSIPETFRNVQANQIVDSANSLLPVFQKINALRNQPKDVKTVLRIVQIGDSHVRSHEFTPGLSDRFEREFGAQAALTKIDGYKTSGIVRESGLSGVVCHSYGVNGATCRNFIQNGYLQKIKDLQPDLLIISFGTNEGMGYYSSEAHYQSMKNLQSLLQQTYPEVAFLYTTPPGAYVRKFSRKRRGERRKLLSVSENKNIAEVARTIADFAAEQEIAYWDLFNIVGGEVDACRNWDLNNYYKADKLHFSAEAYRLQGNLLYEALVRKYNEYIGN